MSRNRIIKNDNPIFKLDSHLIPRPTPDKAESVDAPITMTRHKSIANVVGEPSAFNIHSAPEIL